MAPLCINDRGPVPRKRVRHPFDDILTHDESVALVIKACERYDREIKTGPRALAAFSSVYDMNKEGSE